VLANGTWSGGLSKRFALNSASQRALGLTLAHLP
jgi:hypothetical protein